MNSLNVKQRARKAFEQAYDAQMEGQLDKAVYLYAHSLEWHETPEAHTFLGWAYSFQMKFEQAIAECKKAIEMDPAYGNPYNDIGAYLIELGREEEAVQWLRQAMNAPRYETPHFPCYNLGRVHEKMGDYPQALAHYHQSLDMMPGFDPAQRALDRLRSRSKEAI